MYSAHQVRAKVRRAVKRREDDVEQEEIESGEINTTLPDKGPPAASSTDTKPDQNPDEQPLKLVVSVTKDRALLWSFSGLEGTLQQPKLVLERVGRTGDSCDGAYMCESANCD